jgi:glycosyltransferase involved in cell wall biosynthesis
VTSSPPLRIGVDARELLGDTTGVGRYLSELLRRWVQRGDAARRRFVLFTPAPLSLPLPSEMADVRVLPAAHGGTWWEQTALRSAARREPLDVFFAPAYTAPLRLSVPIVQTIHDVSFLAHPEWFRPRERLRRRWLTRRSARAAAMVLTDSRFSRDEIVRRIPLDPARVQVITPGITPRHPGSAAINRREPLVLYVGSLFNRRRLPHLIEAFAEATRGMPSARLVIVGADRTWPPQDLRGVANRVDAGTRIEVRSYVDDEELASLYSRASVFAFLSEYEGFGLTPLEALSAGVPIVVLDTPVAREVYGAAAIYVPRDGNAAATAGILRRALEDPEVIGAPLSHAPAVLAHYSWGDAAERTLAALEQAAGGRR